MIFFVGALIGIPVFCVLAGIWVGLAMMGFWPIPSDEQITGFLLVCMSLCTVLPAGWLAICEIIESCSDWWRL